MDIEYSSKDHLLTKLRERLNAEKVKLWLPPYTTESKEKGEIPTALVEKYSSELKCSQSDVSEALEDLRLRSLAKLQERDKFQSEGLATLRVKLSNPSPAKKGGNRLVPVECSLDVTGSDFKHLIAAKFDVPHNLIKLICKGRVVQDERSLAEQGVKHGSDMMAMYMSVSEAQMMQNDRDLAEVKKTRRAAELLSIKGDDDDRWNVQIADQKGQPINLPTEEKRALTIAMTLHEKGRAALKNSKVTLALPLLLEADEEFSKCRSDILNSVDNYAILCLDIVWCYFLLKNLEQLPNAESRLSKSEECFKRSYGEKMERLASIKGGTGTEQALFMRLYLLQGIVAFHKGEEIQARNLFGRAQFVLTLLHVDEEKLNQVMLMGFTEREARLGLRAKNGNIQAAVDHIMTKKREKKDIDKQVKKDWNHRVKAKKLGKTVSGQPVNVEHYNNLVALEFPKGAAAEALRQTDNNFDSSLEMLSSHPEMFDLPDPETPDSEVTDEMVQQVVALGFTPDLAKAALDRFKGDIHKTIDEMLKHGGIPPYLAEAAAAIASSSSTSSMSSSLSSPLTASTSKDVEAIKENKELKSVLEDIADNDENDHLDLTLAEEREALIMYQGLLDSVAVRG